MQRSQASVRVQSTCITMFALRVLSDNLPGFCPLKFVRWVLSAEVVSAEVVSAEVLSTEVLSVGDLSAEVLSAVFCPVKFCPVDFVR